MSCIPCDRANASAPGPDEINMGALVQNQSCGLDRIADALHASDPPSAQRRTIHHQGVQLHPPVPRQERSSPGIEGGIVLHGSDGCLDRIERGAAPFEDAPAFLKCVENALLVSIEKVGGDVPGAAMDQKDRGTRHRKEGLYRFGLRAGVKESLSGLLGEGPGWERR